MTLKMFASVLPLYLQDTLFMEGESITIRNGNTGATYRRTPDGDMPLGGEKVDVPYGFIMNLPVETIHPIGKELIVYIDD